MAVWLYPPVVRYTSAPSRGLAVAGVIFWLLITVSVLLWATLGAAAPTGWFKPGLAVLLSAAGAWLLWQQWHLLRVGQLQYRAGMWLFESAASAADSSDLSRIDIHLDGQFCLLLSGCDEHGARQWFWLQRNAQPTHWHALRCALYAPQLPIDEPDSAINNEAKKQFPPKGNT